MSHQDAAEQIAAILRPFRKPPEYDYGDGVKDTIGPDEDIREIVRCALGLLEVDTLGGCPLCMA